MIRPVGRGLESFKVTSMHGLAQWANVRLGTLRYNDGESGILHDAPAFPGEGPRVVQHHRPVRIGNVVVHNGRGEFWVFTQDQYDYWFEES